MAGVDFLSLVLHAGDELHGWGRIRVDADGTWFEPSYAVPLGRGSSEGQSLRWSHAVRVEGHDLSAVHTATRAGGSVRDQMTITGTWRGNSILLTNALPAPRPTSDPQTSQPPYGARSPRSSPELAAAVAAFTPRRHEWACTFSSQWMDPQDRPHLSIGVCRVTEGSAAWAAAHPAVEIHFRSALLPAGIDPVAAAGGWS